MVESGRYVKLQKEMEELKVKNLDERTKERSQFENESRRLEDEFNNILEEKEREIQNFKPV